MKHNTGIGVLALTLAAPAGAQPLIEVQPIRAELDCQLYADYWGLWLVQECRNNFAALATRLGSAVSETGRAQLRHPRAGSRPNYRLSGFITELGVHESGFADTGSSRDGSQAVGMFDFRLTDVSTGQVVLAQTVSARVPISGSSSQSDGLTSYSRSSPNLIYNEIQRQLSLSVARAIAFHFEPIQLTWVDGRTIGLSYGGPLLEIGDLVLVSRPRAVSARFRVIEVTPQGAIAQAVGQIPGVSQGATVTYIDVNDPMQNSGTQPRVELP